MATYSLVFQNRTTNPGSAMIYQTDPDIGPNVRSLAWFSKQTMPSTNVVFQWTTDYSFVWDQTGTLQPGVVFDAEQIWSADLSSSNQITLGYRGSFSFMDQTRGSQQGTLYIKEEGTLPRNEASVGIGMSGAGTFVTQAQANYSLTFRPRPRYWIAFGNFSQGEVLDPDSIANPYEIQFPSGVFSMTAVLNQDNRWSVQRT